MRPYSSGDTAYVVLDGDLNLSRRAEVAAALPDPEHVSTIAINLTRATYIDSLVIGMLVAFRRKFIESGRDPHDLTLLMAKDGAVRRAFEIVGLHRLFPIAYAEPLPRTPEEHIAFAQIDPGPRTSIS